MRIVTFTREAGEPIEALTSEEYKAGGGLPTDWSDFIWQDQPNKQAAIARHDFALDAWTDDVNAGNKPKDTY